MCTRQCVISKAEIRLPGSASRPACQCRHHRHLSCEVSMASIERTAYPQFKRNPVVRELVATYTPTEVEVAFVTEHARQPAHRLTLAILLKTFQRLGYFPSLEDVP